MVSVFLLAAALLQPNPGGSDHSTLFDKLNSRDYFVREAATIELGKRGEKLLPEIRERRATAEELEVAERLLRIERAIVHSVRNSAAGGFRMAIFEPAEFIRGSPAREKGRQPDEAPHPVQFEKTFLVARNEVTQDQFEKFLGFNPSGFSANGENKAKVKDLKTGTFPVESVTWYDALAFCNALSAKDGYDPYYELEDVKKNGDRIAQATVTVKGGRGYRLPTEAEWEYACRAGSATRFHFGEDCTGVEGNYKCIISGGYGGSVEKPGLGRTAPVGGYAANRAGLRDTHGNVAEWCWDCYERDYPVAKVALVDPSGPAAGTHRIVRGGSWLVTDTHCRSASRHRLTPDEFKDFVGFRVARTP